MKVFKQLEEETGPTLDRDRLRSAGPGPLEAHFRQGELIVCIVHNVLISLLNLQTIRLLLVSTIIRHIHGDSNTFCMVYTETVVP